MTKYLAGSIKIKNKKIILNFIGFWIVITIAYFFIVRIHDNWQQFDFASTNFNISWMVIAVILNCICYLFITRAWLLIVRVKDSSSQKISFFRCIGIYNFAQISKYIPGKVVGYLLQLKYLEKIGVNNLSAVYINILILSLTLFYSFLFGISVLIDLINVNENIIFLIFSLTLLILFFPKKNVFEFLIQWIVGKYSGKLNIISITKFIFLEINLCIGLSVIFLGLSGCAVIFAMGLDCEGRLFETITAFIISDALGFLAIFVPGGLGVRELFLYSFLNNLGYGLESLTIPILARIINIITDLILGVIAIYSLYTYRDKI